MPKNKGKGGKNRRRGKNENDKEKGDDDPITINDLNPDGDKDSEIRLEYAQVTRMLGNGRLEARAFDPNSTVRIAHIRGKLRKKVWIGIGDIIMVSIRVFQEDKADVILKYSAEDARKLKIQGELPETAKINETDTVGEQGDDEFAFEFGEDEKPADDKEPERMTSQAIDDI